MIRAPAFKQLNLETMCDICKSPDIRVGEGFSGLDSCLVHAVALWCEVRLETPVATIPKNVNKAIGPLTSSALPGCACKSP